MLTISLLSSPPLLNDPANHPPQANAPDTAAGKLLALAATQGAGPGNSAHTDVQSIRLFLLLFKSAQQHFWTAIHEQEAAMGDMNDLQSVLTVLRNAERGKDPDAKFDEASRIAILESQVALSSNSSMMQKLSDPAAIQAEKKRLADEIAYLLHRREACEYSLEYRPKTLPEDVKTAYIKRFETELAEIKRKLPGLEKQLRNLNDSSGPPPGFATVERVLWAYEVGTNLYDFDSLPTLQKLTETLNSEVEARNRTSQLKMLKVNEWQSVVHEYSTFASEQISKAHDAKISIAHNWT